MGGEGVKLLLCALVVVTFACIEGRNPSSSQPELMHWGQLTFKLYSYPMWHSLNALCPNHLIQLRVQPDIACAHGLLCKINDRFDRPWSSLFEGSPVHTFMQVNSVFTSDNVLESRACLAARLKNMSSVNSALLQFLLLAKFCTRYKPFSCLW